MHPSVYEQCVLVHAACALKRPNKLLFLRMRYDVCRIVCIYVAAIA